MSNVMIRRLKVKVVLTVMAALTIVLGVLFTVLNFSMYQIGKRQTERVTHILALNDGKLNPVKRNAFSSMNTPVFITPKPSDFTRNNDKSATEKQSPRQEENTDASKALSEVMREFGEPFDDIRNYFSVKVDKAGNIIEIVRDFPLHYTDDEILTLTQEVISNGKEKGVYKGVYYRNESRVYGSILVFVDQRIAGNLQTLLLKISLFVYALSMIVAFFISWLFSVWATKPVETAFEKQRQFVADASHELKTPIAVIGANIDVLSGEIGSNKWLDYIKTENTRMSTLVKDLLYLAKYDNSVQKNTFIEFNLGQAVENVALPFESILFDEGKKLELNIEQNIMFTGDENKIKQAVIILIDNAVKNTEKDGEVRVVVKTSGNKKIVSVWNSGEGIEDSEMKKIFERFYRIDTSRARETGGYGLGLAIAKTIMDSHHGKITVTSEKGKWAEFSLIF